MLSKKALAALVIAAVVVAALAVAALRSGQTQNSISGDAAAFFPSLDARLNDVAAVTIATAGGELNIQRSGEDWTLAEKGGYRVDPAKVRRLAIGMSKLSKLEKKTSDPDKYEKLGLRDIGAEGSKASLVTLKDAKGAALASALLGESKGPGRMGGEGSVYARLPGDETCWLLRGEARADSLAKNWLDLDIMKIDPARVRSVVIEHPGGERVAVSKQAPGDAQFAVEDMPEGRELKAPAIAAGQGSALNWLKLEDVAPAGEVEFPADAAAKATFETFDGLAVAVHVVEREGKHWTKFEVSFEAPPAQPEEPAEKAEGDESAEGGEKEEDPYSPEKVRAEAEELAARVNGWAYQVPAFKAAYFTKKMEDFLKEPAAPAPAPPAEAAPPAPAPAAMEAPLPAPAPAETTPPAPASGTNAQAAPAPGEAAPLAGSIPAAESAFGPAAAEAASQEAPSATEQAAPAEEASGKSEAPAAEEEAPAKPDDESAPAEAPANGEAAKEAAF